MIQFSVVLKHLKRHRPDWLIDVKAGRGKHTALIGLCNHVYHDQEDVPADNHYDSRATLGWYENYCHYPNCPNTKITNCLSEVFGLNWDKDLARYECHCPPDAMFKAAAWYRSINAQDAGPGKFKVVILHYEGNTSNYKKNLTHWQAEAIIELVKGAGRIPVILDWDGRSPLPDHKTIFCPGCDDALWGKIGSGDAATIAAMIRQAEAYVGIDSGPGKVASAMDTPSMICWVKHHPIQFHDPAPFTTHLVPLNHQSMPPVCDEGGEGAGRFFRENYIHRAYEGPHGLVFEVQKWLMEILDAPDAAKTITAQTFVLPNGIGDAVWALLKIRSIAGWTEEKQGRPISVISSGNPCTEVGRRSLPFLKRFDFLSEVRVMDVPVHPDAERPANTQGRYVYEADGPRGAYHFLIPNTVLERGNRIEEWMQEYAVDWNVMDHFSWDGTEKGKQLGIGLDPFVAFYLGPEDGHAKEGHNRGWLWEPKHWIELGQAMKDRGMNIAVVGAPYDQSFWDRYVEAGVREARMRWVNLIGKTEIGETFALLKKAKVFFSYQCGLGIVAHYLGVPVVSWWRQDGDSLHPERHICFSDGMKDSWTNPKYKDRYLGCLYRRETVEDIVRWVDEKGFLK